jgi:2-oxoglutarate/2-oxoacid ferredoxin oxidoreductase subunit beta
MSETATQTEKQYTAKDFQTDQDVRWCPGCGDYSILAQTQRVFPDIGVAKKDIVWVSGIGCSSRFPYYMSTYGLHGIHGRAPAIATGVKAVRPDLSVWVATGDGDLMSIGGNHFIHACRRNIGIKILLFNNQIYGLTKGQYSPTSEFGKITKSTPFGSIDHPFNPVALALGAECSFVARSLDRDPKHLQTVIRAAAEHTGTAFIEIYQNCNVFNDGAFFHLTEKGQKEENVVVLEHGKPLVFGANSEKGIILDGFSPRVVRIDNGKYSVNDLLVHDEAQTDDTLAHILSRMFHKPDLPTPIGIFHRVQRPTYDAEMQRQVDTAKEKRGSGDLDKLFNRGETWVVKDN